MKISVLTCTARPEGIPLVQKALKRQTFKDFEHIIQEKTPTKPGNSWSLCADYNLAIKQSKGDLIVSWQDWTFADPTCLEKFWYHFTKEPKTLVTAVGNKYADDTWTVKTWQDPRERSDQGTYYPCYPSDIEANLCSIPRQALYDVGGFDEDMDKWYGLDFFNVAQRIDKFGGYDFKIDQTIKSYSLEHGRLSKDWDKNNWMFGDRYNNHIAKRREEEKYPVLSYL